MSDLMSQGLNLALYGMGTVFFFLTLLVVATMLMSRLVPVAEIEPSAGQEGGVDPKIRAAIGAAIHHHRQRKNE
ncbi:MAG: OadG family transporter subunit [Gammaproteobacteria bacterium]|nr:OadG family transporter subunit [Gammaproteobacteria bacterium]